MRFRTSVYNQNASMGKKKNSVPRWTRNCAITLSPMKYRKAIKPWGNIKLPTTSVWVQQRLMLPAPPPYYFEHPNRETLLIRSRVRFTSKWIEDHWKLIFFFPQDLSGPSPKRIKVLHNSADMNFSFALSRVTWFFRPRESRDALHSP